jgi:K+/H+ antiporter YhaU regulatory subunit KhtT
MADVQESHLPGVASATTSSRPKVSASACSCIEADGASCCCTTATIRTRAEPWSGSTPMTRELLPTLADLLGASHVSEQLAAMQQIEGLAIDWVTIPPTGAAVGRSLRDAGLRSETGVSIVAVVRGDETVPAPPADFTLEPGDTAVVVGTPAGIERLTSLLHGA